MTINFGLSLASKQSPVHLKLQSYALRLTYYMRITFWEGADWLSSFSKLFVRTASSLQSYVLKRSPSFSSVTDCALHHHAMLISANMHYAKSEFDNNCTDTSTYNLKSIKSESSGPAKLCVAANYFKVLKGLQAVQKWAVAIPKKRCTSKVCITSITDGQSKQASNKNLGPEYCIPSNHCLCNIAPWGTGPFSLVCANSTSALVACL